MFDWIRIKTVNWILVISNAHLSDISGKKFTKISADFQELIDWNLIESKPFVF
jgi:hypothetical protein